MEARVLIAEKIQGLGSGFWLGNDRGHDQDVGGRDRK